jgi:predicted RNA-binding Zn ribbon-like protein
LVFTFDKIQKAAPSELTDAFKKMRPLIEELNKKVKSGEVHDRDSLQALLIGLNESNQAALEQWVQGQATVVPFIKAHCP